MTKFTGKTFTVGPGTSDAYRDNFDRTFKPKLRCPACVEKAQEGFDSPCPRCAAPPPPREGES